MTESDYWQALRRKLKNRVYAWKINASYIKGVPDWWASGSKQDLWVENKRVLRIPQTLTLVDPKKYLTAHQQMWLEERYEEGRNVAVIAFSEEGHVLFDDLEWMRPISKRSFLEKAMSMGELANYIVEILGERSKIAP
jgi:hypothetical protein